MPIKIPSGLPANEIMSAENIFVMNELRAATQDIRPLRIAILNLMPTKITTETQLIRLLSNSSLQIELSLLYTSTHTPRHTSVEHLQTFYHNFAEIENQKFDGLIITGAPLEHHAFEQIDYWQELCRIMEWSRSHVFSTMHICWAAQAGLYYHYGIGKHELLQKLSGVFSHYLIHPRAPIVRGFDEVFFAPHSRYTALDETQIRKNTNLEIIASSTEAGPYIISARDRRMLFITGHAEYDRDTLALEYRRDLAKGLAPRIPAHYFPGDDPNATPKNIWRGHAHLLFSNWLNYYVYQQTPYNLDDLHE